MFGQIDKEAVGIDRLAGTDDLVPASFAGRAAGIDHLRSAGVAMRDQHDIVAVGASTPSVR